MEDQPWYGLSPEDLTPEEAEYAMDLGRRPY